MSGKRYAPATLPPRNDPVLILKEAVLAPGPVWTRVENLAPTGIRSPDRPARNSRYPMPAHTAHTEPF